MRILWLLGSLVCFFAAGILIVRPTWPAWRIYRPNANPAGISEDGRQLLTISSSGEKPKTCQVLDTQTTGIVESWNIEGEGTNTLYYSKEEGFGSLRTELIPLAEGKPSQVTHQLRVLDTKNRRDFYIGSLRLGTQSPRINGTRVLGSLLAVNLDVASTPPREFSLQHRVLVLIDRAAQTHRIVEQSYLSVVSGDYKYYLMLDEKGGSFVADSVALREVLRIPGQSIGLIDPEGEGYRVLARNSAPGQADKQHYSRYFWKPGYEPRLIEKSASFSNFGTLPMMGPFVDARSNVIYFRRPMKQEWPTYIQSARHGSGWMNTTNTGTNTISLRESASERGA